MEIDTDKGNYFFLFFFKGNYLEVLWGSAFGEEKGRIKRIGQREVELQYRPKEGFHSSDEEFWSRNVLLSCFTLG